LHGPVKLNQNSIKKLALILTLSILSATLRSGAQQRFTELDIYVCAHQDDWQLFMGANVYNDINAFDETNPAPNGKKVVLIYTTAGNLHDDDDSKTCNCRDPLDHSGKPFPYWKVREEGAKHSVHLAACRMGGWGPGIPYPRYQAVVINGHSITKYQFKNTVSYFLRMKAGSYSQWFSNPEVSVGTVDTSTTYADYADFVNTLYRIYKAEADSSLLNKNIHFNCQDIDEQINPNDHHDHLIAGRGASEAAALLGKEMDTCFAHTLFTDYNTQNLPANLSGPDAQNEAAVTAVYCLALLDYNAWPEWGSLYQEWTSRNYFRTITTCQAPVAGNIMAQDSLETLNLRLYPSPADNNVFVRFNLPVDSEVEISVFDAKGATVFHFKGLLPCSNFPINTTAFPAGYYLAAVTSCGKALNKTLFEVSHH